MSPLINQLGGIDGHLQSTRPMGGDDYTVSRLYSGFFYILCLNPPGKY